jgi:hypothetical protein
MAIHKIVSRLIVTFGHARKNGINALIFVKVLGSRKLSGGTIKNL